jgi:hypothetical protein
MAVQIELVGDLVRHIECASDGWVGVAGSAIRTASNLPFSVITVRWKVYPLLQCTHCMTSPDSIKQLKKDWLDNLSSKVPTAGDASQSFVWVRLRVGTSYKDDYVQIALPWMLIATTDAYDVGNYFERNARAPLDGTSFISGVCSTG